MLLERLTVIALAALTIACGEDSPVLKVGANGTSFQREAVPTVGLSAIVATVPYTTSNRGNATLFIPTCGSHLLPVVERLVNGRWESYASGFCVLNMAMVPLELHAGESHQDEVAIGDAGRFRIRMPYSADAQSSKHFDTISLPFDVH